MNILNFVMVGSNDYKKSSAFYDAVFEPLKLKKILTRRLKNTLVMLILMNLRKLNFI